MSGRARKAIVIAAVMLMGTTLAGRASADVSNSAPVGACEVHVWQSRSYVAASPSPLAAYGLIGAALQSVHDARYPGDTIQGQMERELAGSGLASLVAAAPWQLYLGDRPINVVVEDAAVSKDDIRQARTSPTRRAPSTAPCYVELYIGDLSFEGGFIKSHLFANLTVRRFTGSVPAGGNAIVWTQLRGFPAKDEAGIPSATAALRGGFVEDLAKFLAKKMPAATGSD